MASDLPEPKSRKEQYLAKSAGMDVEIPAEPKSREEQYLNAIAEGGGGGGGYVLPIASADTLGGVKIGENLSIDANGILSALGGGSAAKEITTADYNYPEGNPDRIDLSTLDDGAYYSNIPSDMAWQYHGMGSAWSTPCSFIKIGDAFIHRTDSDSRIFYLSGYSDVVMITSSQVANNLTTNSSINALSARQGVILKQMINYDLGNNGDDYPAASPDGLKLWDLNDGNYYLDMPRKIYLDSDINNGIDGFQGWIKVMRMSDGSAVDPEFTYIKIYGVMGDTTPFEVHQTTRRSNGVKISCQLVDTTNS